MNPQDSPQLPQSDPFSVMQPGERVICEIKRHPIGIFGIYFAAGALLIVLALLAFVVAPGVAGGDSRGQIMAIGAVSFLVLALMIVAFVFVSNQVYWGNSWVVTSDSITQTTQTSLFHKQSSQLSLGHLEDVSAAQDGILPHMLNYGTLRVETAGERSKFLFMYCPNPNYFAQKILAAREVFEQDRRAQPPAAQPQQQEPPPVPPAPAYGPAATQPQPPQYPTGAPAASSGNPPYEPPRDTDSNYPGTPNYY